jgi:hypothetical protein
MQAKAIVEYFQQTPALARLCSQNGWPDPDSLQVEVLKEDAGRVFCNVTFDEILMEGAGCVAGRVSCWGRYRLCLDATGRVIDARLVAGEAEVD